MRQAKTTEAKRGSLKPLIRMMREAKVPWLAYIFFFALNLYVTNRGIYLYEVAGRIMGGEIHDPTLVREYLMWSLIVVAMGFLIIPNAWVSIQFQRRSQQRAWDTMLRLPLSRYDLMAPSSLVSRVTTDSAFVSNIMTYIVNVFQNGYAIYLAVGVLYRSSARLTYYVAPLIIISALVTIFAGKFAFSINYMLQQIESRLTSFLNERISGLNLIKASQTEKQEISQGEGLTESKFKAQMKRTYYNASIQGFQNFLRLAVTAIVLILGSYLVDKGEMEIGGLITFFMLSISFPGTVQSFFRAILDIITIQGQTQVVAEINDLPRESLESELSPEGKLGSEKLSFENMKFGYFPEQEVIRDFTEEIEPGKLTAIVGPSGSGKTTMLKLIERLYEPDSGEFALGDASTERYHRGEWRSNTGYIIQNSPLLPGTIKENILYGQDADLSEAEWDKLLEICALKEVIDELPAGLSTEVGEIGDRLSGGQRQRIAIARALVGNPELLLMDEATANLDARGEATVTENILRERKGKTTVVVAHRLSTVQNADKIIVMDEGKIAAAGKADWLYENSELYRELVDLQEASA
ncbi:MAG: ABC transporter ATP-binding protein [Eubacteriales bacterium]|nr:ABC transporter ATP-binding protein [Eubacteriales bacterium]